MFKIFLPLHCCHLIWNPFYAPDQIIECSKHPFSLKKISKVCLKFILHLMETWLLFDIMSHDGEDLEDFNKLALGLLSVLVYYSQYHVLCTGHRSVLKLSDIFFFFPFCLSFILKMIYDTPKHKMPSGQTHFFLGKRKKGGGKKILVWV